MKTVCLQVVNKIIDLFLIGLTLSFMKYIRRNISALGFIICAFVIIGCSETNQDASYTDLNTKEAFKLTQNPDVLLLDVRTPAEHTRARIKKSFLIPVQVLKEDYKKIKDYKNKKILIYCHSGNRSVTASKILMQQGFKKVYNLKGGIIDWAKNKYPVQFSK